MAWRDGRSLLLALAEGERVMAAAQLSHLRLAPVELHDLVLQLAASVVVLPLVVGVLLLEPVKLAV